MTLALLAAIVGAEAVRSTLFILILIAMEVVWLLLGALSGPLVVLFELFFLVRLALLLTVLLIPPLALILTLSPISAALLTRKGECSGVEKEMAVAMKAFSCACAECSARLCSCCPCSTACSNWFLEVREDTRLELPGAISGCPSSCLQLKGNVEVTAFDVVAV